MKILNAMSGNCFCIQAPSIHELRTRLEIRGTETSESLEERVQKAEKELQYASRFDAIIVNDDLQTATNQLITTVKDFLSEETDAE